MDVKPDGTIDITWYDRRNDASDKLWDVYIARSIDGGNTFSTNIPINDQNFASPQNPWGVPWMGEYLGLAVDSTHAYVVFTTSVNDTYGDVYFDKIILNEPPGAPTITAPTEKQNSNTPVQVKFNAVDPDNDQVKFHIDWGDGNTEVTGLNPSGQDLTVTHTYSYTGDEQTYTIKAKAEDSNGLFGPESTEPIVISRAKARIFSLFDVFPNLFSLLNILFG